MDKEKLFYDIRNNNFIEVEKFLDSHKDLDYNIKDDNGLYFIFYVMIANSENILTQLLQTNIRTDIYDLEGKSLLYIPIKFGYNKLVRLILDYNKQIVGVPIQTISDSNGSIPINYAISFQNIDCFNMLLSETPMTNLDVDGNSVLHSAVISRSIQFTKDVFAKTGDPNIQNNTGETPLHIACRNSQFDIINFLVKHKADVNIQEFENQLSPLHYACFSGNQKIVSLLLDYDANINIQDYNGNTPLHYSVLYDHPQIVSLLLNHPKTISHINTNLFNITLSLPLHIAFTHATNNLSDYVSMLLQKTNINFQNKMGTTCLHELCKNGLWKDFTNIIENKKNDILIKNHKNERPIDYISKNDYDTFINMITTSYVNSLTKTGKIWITDWENECPKNTKKCFQKVKTKILTLCEKPTYECDNKTYPIKTKSKRCMEMYFDDRINFSTIVGIALDKVCGTIFLQKKHKKLSIVQGKIDINDKEKLNFYSKHNIPHNSEYMFEKYFVTWYNSGEHLNTHRNSITPSSSDKSESTRCCKFLNIENDAKSMFLDIKQNNKQITHIAFLINIMKLEGNGHTNVLMYTIASNELERFDPFGSGFYGDMDIELEKYFKNLISNVKYISPSDYTSPIGIQKIDITENRNEYIGDPNGYCSAWSLWYIDMRMTYPDINRNKLMNYIIQQINVRNLKFRSIIRNYSKNITDVRDIILKKNHIDINQYLNEEYDYSTILNIINDINNEIHH